MEFDERDELLGFGRLDRHTGNLWQQDNDGAHSKRDLLSIVHRRGGKRSAECFGDGHHVDADSHSDSDRTDRQLLGEPDLGDFGRDDASDLDHRERVEMLGVRRLGRVEAYSGNAEHHSYLHHVDLHADVLE